jgi:DNA polymerase-3 subunit delta
MKNIFLLFGEEGFLINDTISQIEKQHPHGQVIKYDLTEKNISTLIEDCSMVSLFDEEKIIIGENAYFLSGAVKKENVNHDIDALSNYIDHPNPHTVIILVVPTDKLDKRKSIVKKLLDNVEVKEFNKLTDKEMIEYAKKLFANNGYQINFKALNMLIDKVGNDLYLLHNECQKLMLYKIDDKQISEENIEEMVEKYDFADDFTLANAVIKKDINTSLSIYQQLLKRNEEPIKIIVILANQFRLIFQVKRLTTKGFSENQIVRDLGVHPYRVKLAKEVKLNDKELLKYLSLLADLDENIKMGKINKEVGLELFLLKL